MEPESLLLNFTGNGKGKTSAALGVALRTLGRGGRVAVIQFLKNEEETGERLFFQKKFPDIIFESLGAGLTSQKGDHQGAARRAWGRAAELLRTFDGELLILDELNVALDCGFLSEEEVLSSLQNRLPRLNVIVTGRGAPQVLREICNLVSDIQEVKHPFRRGISARIGLDY